MADEAHSTPASDPILAIREGLERYFAEQGITIDLDAVFPPLPEPEPASRDDAHLADAFRDLESAIGDLRRMSALMEMAAGDTVFRTESGLEKRIHEQMGLSGFRIHVLSEDQSDGIDYAIRHTYDLIQSLYRKYYAGYGEAA